MGLAVRTIRESASAQVLSRLRAVCAALPDAHETVAFGHPTFRVKERMFAVLEEYRGELTVAVKVGKAMQSVFLKDARFLRTPYLGQHGWVSLRLNAGGAATDWDEVASLVRGSYELVSAKRR